MSQVSFRVLFVFASEWYDPHQVNSCTRHCLCIMRSQELLVEYIASTQDRYAYHHVGIFSLFTMHDYLLRQKYAHCIYY